MQDAAFESKLPDAVLQRVEVFFTENVLNPELIFLAPNKGDTEFFNHPVRLPRLKPISPEQHAHRLRQMESIVRGGDALFVLDQKSIVSRLIAIVDQGTWSHVASCSGYGTVHEAITAGIVERPLSVYFHHRYRLGIYRIDGITEEQLLKMNVFAWSQRGSNYDWPMAIRLGLKKILRVRHKDATTPSPNDLVAWSYFRLVHIV